MDRHIVCLQIPAFRIVLARAADSALRNRPVAVAAMHTPRAVIREISTEAFHEGVQPGMTTDLARLICPGLRMIPPDFSLTQAAHRELQHRISSFAPACESIRPGSLFLDLTGTTRLFGPPLDTATRISRELAHRQGWPSTIGVAGNKLVSQLAATTLTKPPQVLSIHSGCERPFLAPLPTMLLPGLHRAHTSRILQRLEDLNLLTLGAIASVSLAHLRVVLGPPANLLHDWALGIDPSPVHPPIAQPVIERSIDLNPDDVDDRLLLGRLYRLLEQMCATLRQRQRTCRHISLTVRHSDHVEQTVHETLLHGTCWETDLQPVLTGLFYRCFRRRVRLTRLMLRVSRLEPPARQLSLFDQPESVVLPRSHRLSLALDQVRAKFGEQAVSWGKTLTRAIHDGSSRNREVARQDRRVEPRGKETCLKQFVDRPSGELACWPAVKPQASCRSRESTIAAELLMNNAHKMQAAEFIHLHVHSDYSPMRGVSPLEELCLTAQRQGSPSIALTDTNGLYGAIRFVEQAKQQGLRPILGAELTTDDHRTVLLAKTPDGYANLCRLLSERHCNPSFDFLPSVSRYRDGLIAFTDDERALIAWAKDSRQDLYVELTPGPAMHDSLRFSRRINLPPVATNRVYFSRADDFATHRLLRAIALNTTLSRLREEACCTPGQWLMPSVLMASRFTHAPDALENSLRIAEGCHSDWRFGETIFPAFRRLSDQEAFALLKAKTYEGAVARYRVLSKQVCERIEKELAIICQKGFARYFLVVEEIVRQAPRTCGRGSVAASIVSYCLNITHVDPITHNLFFERFLNPGRKDPPDIDIDFPWDERDDILKWVFGQYGERQAAMVANQNSLGFRAAIREVAKVYGMPAEEIGKMSALVVRQKTLLGFSSPPTNEQWLRRLSQVLKLKEPWPEILVSALKAQNHFRHLSLHCGGVVIVPGEIRRYVPIEITAKGLPVIQWEKDQTEDAGLVKIDILGNRSLAVIRDALAAIAKHTGRQIDYATWDPLDDTATQDAIRCGDTIGCFYIESPATRLLLRKLWTGMPSHRRAKADVFDYLVMVSSLIRPATNPFVEKFIRLAQAGSCAYWHPKLEGVLDETHGIMTYQEDVSKVAMALADFSVEDADQLRKIISKKHKQRQLRDYYQQFYRGAEKNHASPKVIRGIWEMMMSFSGYSFCKPHSASYAQVSFKSAYLRTHYPAEFMAAVISNRGGFYSTFAYVSEARRMGLAILLPDINDSDWAYRGEGERLRMGLMQVKTIPEELGKRIVEERAQNGPYRSLQDFLRRVQPGPSHARTLIRAGCCDSIAGELTRSALMWRLYAGNNFTSRSLPIPDDNSAVQKRAHEIESFGFLASRHPLTLYRQQIERLRPVPASEMPRYAGQRITMVGLLITEKSAETNRGHAMEFITLEDVTALYDATLFPDVYRRCCHLLSPNRPYVVRGVVEEAFGVVTLTVHDLHLLESTMDEGNHPLPLLQEAVYGESCDALPDLPPNSSPPS